MYLVGFSLYDPIATILHHLLFFTNMVSLNTYVCGWDSMRFVKGVQLQGIKMAFLHSKSSWPVLPGSRYFFGYKNTVWLTGKPDQSTEEYRHAVPMYGRFTLMTCQPPLFSQLRWPLQLPKPLGGLTSVTYHLPVRFYTVNLDSNPPPPYTCILRPGVCAVRRTNHGKIGR